MKTVKLVVAVAVVAALQTTAFATQPSASGSGGVVIANTVSGNFAVGQNGASTSYAQNSEAGTAKVTAMANYTNGYGAVNAGVKGETTTSSAGNAYNISSGTGNGTASSIGSVNAGVSGVVAIQGVTTGRNGGNASTQSNNQVDAATNQGSYVAGATKSGFETQIQYSRTYESIAAPAGTTGGTRIATVSIADQKSGYASGDSRTGVVQLADSVTGVLQNMNAAGLANIGASGMFFAKAGLSADTGIVSAP
jgi:hypothetical protein